MSRDVPPARATTVTVAAVLVGVTGVGFLGLAVGSLAAGHAGFSGGVALMLALYGLLVLGVAALLWRGVGAGLGLGVAVSLLHVLVFASLAHHEFAWVALTACGVAVATLVLLLAPASRRSLGRY